MHPYLDRFPYDMYLHFLRDLRIAYVSGPDHHLFVSYAIDDRTGQERLTGLAHWRRNRLLPPSASRTTAVQIRAMEWYNYVESFVYPNRAAEPSRMDVLERGLSDKLSAKLVLKKTGELLSLRAQLNHYSDITDHLPDMFWDSESNLEDYYNQTGIEMDVRSRIAILNRKIDYAHENVSVLREMASENHSTRLEWIIIILISVEVFFEFRRVYKEEWGGWAKEQQEKDEQQARPT